MPSEFDKLLRFAMELCDAADRIALQHFRRNVRIEKKPDLTLVTEADRTIEERLRERIMAAYPRHGLMGEEFGHSPGDGENCWLIDPIDATANYARGIPIFATLLALERGGDVVLGVVSAPAMRERWHATRGGGAWSRSRQLRVSEVSSISDAQIFYGTDRGSGFEPIFDAAWRARGFGDFWGYVLVAEGAGEAMLEPEVSPWDLAAPLVLVEEAGGRFTDLEGRRTHTGGSALASNGLLHDTLLARVKST